MVNKAPSTTSVETLTQQTLDSLVKKTKHGRNLAKKLDTVEKKVVKEEPPQENGRVDSKHDPEKEESPEQRKPEVTKEPKKEPKREPVKREPVKSVSQARSSRNTRGKKHEKEVKAAPEERCQKLTDFFPVRRSKRQPLSKIKDLEYEQLRDNILNKCTNGLEIRLIEGKGRGVFSTRDFARKEFIVEYSGTLISYEEAKRREAKYASEPDKYGCYMYYFVFKNKKYCVDGTAEDGSYGRLLNHSKNGNVESKLININSKPVLILVARDYIAADTELCYDYGERSKDIIESHPWLNQ